MVSRIPSGAQRASGADDSEGSDEDIDERFERRVLKPLPVGCMSGGVRGGQDVEGEMTKSGIVLWTSTLGARV